VRRCGSVGGGVAGWEGVWFIPFIKLVCTYLILYEFIIRGYIIGMQAKTSSTAQLIGLARKATLPCLKCLCCLGCSCLCVLCYKWTERSEWSKWKNEVCKWQVTSMSRLNLSLICTPLDLSQVFQFWGKIWPLTRSCHVRLDYAMSCHIMTYILYFDPYQGIGQARTGIEKL